MLDVIFMAAIVLFFLLALAYTRFCEKLGGEAKNK
jgi:hypothetical protein